MTLKGKTTVTFYNGLTTIGGPMIEVAYAKAHVLFDLGEVYEPQLGLSSKQETFTTLIKNHLIGRVPNFYDPALTGKKIDTKRWQDSAAYISHVHLDHSKAMNWLAPEIPLYAGPITARFLPALNRTGNFLLPAAGHAATYTRPIRSVSYRKAIHVGQITMEIWPSDHDAFGATGLILQTPTCKIAYTGDIRLHGFHPTWVHRFLKAARGCQLLICEGTGVSWPEEDKERRAKSQEFAGPKSEQELVENFCRLEMENPKRQITFNTYLTNIERLLQIIKASPRTVVLTARRALLIKQTLNKDLPYYYFPGEVPSPELNSDLAVPYDRLLQDNERYCWQVVGRYQNLQSGGLYIHSNAQPLGDFDPAFKPFVEQFKERVVEFKSLTCSGHANVAELREIIKEVQPAILAPVHTLHPELEKNPFGKRILPQRGTKITLG